MAVGQRGGLLEDLLHLLIRGRAFHLPDYEGPRGEGYEIVLGRMEARRPEESVGDRVRGARQIEVLGRIELEQVDIAFTVFDPEAG